MSGGISSSGVTVGANRSTIRGDFANVAEQSGIVAGAGGYHVAVGGGVDLKAGVIASSADAWAKPIKIEYIPSNYGPTFRYTGSDAVIVVNVDGKFITGLARNSSGVGK